MHFIVPKKSDILKERIGNNHFYLVCFCFSDAGQYSCMNTVSRYIILNECERECGLNVYEKEIKSGEINIKEP